MKKRDDITIYEYAEVLKKRGYSLQPMMKDLLGEPEPTSVPFDWPASFYEEPPAGSFGRFYGAVTGSSEWGYLDTMKGGGSHPVRRRGGGAWSSFVPGLPQDVTADGMPLEAEL